MNCTICNLKKIQKPCKAIKIKYSPIYKLNDTGQIKQTSERNYENIVTQQTILPEVSTYIYPAHSLQNSFKCIFNCFKYVSTQNLHIVNGKVMSIL